jgi:uncharacterized protein
MWIPTDEEIRALHQEHAPSREAFDLVHTHCEIVCAIAEQLLDRTDLHVDRDLVRAGCLLHDIGVYRIYDELGKEGYTSYIRHGVLGHDLLRDAGFPDYLCRFCSCHVGMGISRDDVRRQGLPIPVADYLAESGEEDLVMYADKFHSKTTPPVFLTPASYASKIESFGADKVTRFVFLRDRFGEPDLTPLTAKYGHALI